MEEACEEPPHFLLEDEYYVIFRDHRQVFISGKEPDAWQRKGRNPGRDWSRFQRSLVKEPPWERALRYREIMEREGLSIRGLARALERHPSGIARTLEILRLPEGVSLRPPQQGLDLEWTRSSPCGILK
jgi:hypothetical protein